jgi:DNA-binding phage protein
MAEPLERMLADILALGRAAGMTHAALAERAGLTPETLSRLRHKGDCRLATLIALAEAVGLEVVLRPEGSAAVDPAPPVHEPPLPPVGGGQRPRHLL